MHCGKNIFRHKLLCEIFTLFAILSIFFVCFSSVSKFAFADNLDRPKVFIYVGTDDDFSSYLGDYYSNNLNAGVNIVNDSSLIPDSLDLYQFVIIATPDEGIFNHVNTFKKFLNNKKRILFVGETNDFVPDNNQSLKNLINKLGVELNFIECNTTINNATNGLNKDSYLIKGVGDAPEPVLSYNLWFAYSIECKSLDCRPVIAYNNQNFLIDVPVENGCISVCCDYQIFTSSVAVRDCAKPLLDNFLFTSEMHIIPEFSSYPSEEGQITPPVDTDKKEPKQGDSSGDGGTPGEDDGKPDGDNPTGDHDDHNLPAVDDGKPDGGDKPGGDDKKPNDGDNGLPEGGDTSGGTNGNPEGGDTTSGADDHNDHNPPAGDDSGNGDKPEGEDDISDGGDKPGENDGKPEGDNPTGDHDDHNPEGGETTGVTDEKPGEDDNPKDADTSDDKGGKPDGGNTTIEDNENKSESKSVVVKDENSLVGIFDCQSVNDDFVFNNADYISDFAPNGIPHTGDFAYSYIVFIIVILNLSIVLLSASIHKTTNIN